MKQTTEGNVTHVDFGRTARHVVVVKNPDVIISTAADLSMADKLRAAGEYVCQYIEKTQSPLNPKDRSRLMRALAVLHDEPLQ